MTTVKIGIIGGSGLYKMDALQDTREVVLDTPFGSPSDALIIGTLEGTPVAFLARHGRNHHFLPTELPYRANIHAMKQLGVEYIISASAVGSLSIARKPVPRLFSARELSPISLLVIQFVRNWREFSEMRSLVSIYPISLSIVVELMSVWKVQLFRRKRNRISTEVGAHRLSV
jgi:Phosphorylase superfamily